MLQFVFPLAAIAVVQAHHQRPLLKRGAVLPPIHFLLLLCCGILVAHSEVLWAICFYPHHSPLRAHPDWDAKVGGAVAAPEHLALGVDC